MAKGSAIWLEPIRNEVNDCWDYIVTKTKNTLTVVAGEQLSKDKVKDLIWGAYDVTITLHKEKKEGERGRRKGGNRG